MIYKQPNSSATSLRSTEIINYITIKVRGFQGQKIEGEEGGSRERCTNILSRVQEFSMQQKQVNSI